jgi:hypothetical protein
LRAGPWILLTLHRYALSIYQPAPAKMQSMHKGSRWRRELAAGEEAARLGQQASQSSVRAHLEVIGRGGGVGKVAAEWRRRSHGGAAAAG